MSRVSWFRKVPRRALIPVVVALWVAWFLFPPEVISVGWGTSYPAALEIAKQSGHPILADFTGSDFCAPCQRLQRDVFNTAQFGAYAATNLVLLQLDFPAWKELPKEQAAANQALFDQFKVEGFPTVILISPEGKELGRMMEIAARSPVEFIGEIEKILKPR